MFTRFGPTWAMPLLLMLGLSGTVAGCATAPEAASGPTSSSSTTASLATPTSSAATSETVMRIAERLAWAGRAKPYSAQMDIRSLVGGRTAVVMTGRINMNLPEDAGMTGHLAVRTTTLDTGEPPIAVDEVMTDGILFVRTMKTRTAPAGRWQRVPKSVADAGSLPDLSDYTRLLLLGGPSVVKGQEKQGGVPATRLSGRIETEQIRTVEPNLYDRLRTASVDGFDCDIWIDADGRTIRLEQWVLMQGRRAHNIMTLAKFRAPVTVRAPVN